MAKKTTKNKTNKTEIVVRVQNETSQFLPIPSVTELAEPMKDNRKLTIPKTWLTDKQITRLVEKTPAQFVYKRPGRGGGKWDYVTVAYVQKVLDFIFGFNWDFEIVEHGKESDHVWVLGKLTVYNENGSRKIVKSQFGRSDVKQSNGKNLDYGNDLKAAASDALKKCASMLGIARDIYGKTEYQQESGIKPKEAPVEVLPKTEVVQKEQVIKKGQVIGPDGEAVYLCADTGQVITEAEYEYSMKMFGKSLSREAQKNHKHKK